MAKWTSISFAWTMLLLVAALLVGCGTAASPQPATQGIDPVPFMLALPRIVVDVDTAGNLKVLGLSPAMFGMDARLPKPLVDSLVSGNVQHIEIRGMGNTLLLLANGQPLPHIGWNDQELERTVEVAQAFVGPDLAIVKKLLPLVRRLGLDVVLRLPKQPGAADIPLVSLDEGARLSVSQPASGPATAVIKMDLKIDNKGLPGILDLTSQDLAPLGVAMAPVLDGAAIQRVQAANIQHMQIRTQPGTLRFYANGQPLAHLIWDARLLNNAVELYGKLQPDSPYREIAKTLAPGLDQADINIVLLLPQAAGAQAVSPPLR